MKRIFIILLLLSPPAFGADPWTKAQVGQQVAFTVLLAADWAQTRDIKNHPDIYESNPILGPNPPDEEVDQYFAIAAVGHLAVAHVLPGKWRDVWQYVWIGREAVSVENNYSLGVRFDF